jgi:hypothetical protein
MLTNNARCDKNGFPNNPAWNENMLKNIASCDENTFTSNPSCDENVLTNKQSCDENMFIIKFEDTDGNVNWRRKYNTIANQKEQRDKQRSTKHYTENKRSINMNPTKNRRWSHMLRWGKQFLLRMSHPSCYSCQKPSDNSWMGKRTDYDYYYKRNISEVVCDTETL